MWVIPYIPVIVYYFYQLIFNHHPKLKREIMNRKLTFLRCWIGCLIIPARAETGDGF